MVLFYCKTKWRIELTMELKRYRESGMGGVTCLTRSVEGEWMKADEVLAELSRLEAEREKELREAWDASRKVIRKEILWSGDPRSFADYLEAEEDNAFAAFLHRKEKGVGE
jgi:hypothetical protein